MKTVFWVVAVVLCSAYLLVFAGMLVFRLMRARRSPAAEHDAADTLPAQSSLQSEDILTMAYNPSEQDADSLSENETTQTLPEIEPEQIKIPEKELDVQESACAEAASATSIGTRAYQQDAVCVSFFGAEQRFTSGILCDGMGGLQGGERASGLAVKNLSAWLQDEPGTDYPKLMERMALRVNEQVRELRDETGRRIEAGSTLTWTVVDPDGRMYWCSIGDSHIYLYHEQQLTQLNEDHTFGVQLDEMARNGQISIQDARANPRRAALTSYLGIPSLRLIDNNRQPLSLAKGDIVLQCSDGLYRSLTTDMMCDILKNALDLKTAAAMLVNSALAVPGSHDNTTVLLIGSKAFD